MRSLVVIVFLSACSLSLHAQKIDSGKLAKALHYNRTTAGDNSMTIPLRDSNYQYVVNETILTWKEYIAFPKEALPDKGITIRHDKASLKKYHAENKLGVVIFHE